MNRRNFLQGLLGASAATVAAQFGAPEWMGEEIKEELVKDLSRTSISIPGQVFDNRPVWTSISGVRQVWVDHVAKELARQIDRDILDSVSSDIERTVNTMVRAVDMDVRKAKKDFPEGGKIIIQTPRVRVKSHSYQGSKPIFELKAGLEKKKGLFDDEFRVGYLQEEIYVG